MTIRQIVPQHLVDKFNSEPGFTYFYQNEKSKIDSEWHIFVYANFTIVISFSICSGYRIAKVEGKREEDFLDDYGICRE
jgi:hypothetical protein